MEPKTTFIAKIQKNYRITIPKNIRRVTQLKQGDYVEVSIRKILAKTSPQAPQP